MCSCSYTFGVQPDECSGPTNGTSPPSNPTSSAPFTLQSLPDITSPVLPLLDIPLDAPLLRDPPPTPDKRTRQSQPAAAAADAAAASRPRSCLTMALSVAAFVTIGATARLSCRLTEPCGGSIAWSRVGMSRSCAVRENARPPPPGSALAG